MSRRDDRDQGALVYGAIPRAHLMPPEVALRRKESARRTGLLLATAAVVAVTVLGIVGSAWFSGTAEVRLADERRVTEQLLATQLEFSEVTIVRGQLQSITDLRSQLAQTEVLWNDTLAPYLAVLAPTDVVEAVTFSANAPAQPVLGTTGPLRSPRVATMTMTVQSPGLPAPQAWIRAWEQVETFADASIDSVTVQEAGYVTIVTINLSDAAISQRFAEEDESE